MKNMSRRSSITFDKGSFFLETENTSYIFRVTPFGHLEHVHWGARVSRGDAEALSLKRSSQYGSSVMYSKNDSEYCLDVVPLEWSGEGRGDYRRAPIDVRLAPGQCTTDFRYVSHSITKGSVPMSGGLPTAYGGEQTLAVLLRDEPGEAELTLYYTVYPAENVITRRCALRNTGAAALTVHKLMSMSVDIERRGLTMTTFTGGWISEMRRTDAPVICGTLVNESRTGASSNRANPGFLLSARGATESAGMVWGFNLVYSGNHHSSVSADEHGCVRVMSGVNPDRFDWTLGSGESFETPEAVLSFSGEGFNGLSHNMHDFVNAHIVRGEWANRERPVLVNVWEAFMFDFTLGGLLSVAHRARRLGVELFVLDDGWFGKRDHDRAGLGDYRINARKLPKGLPDLVRRVTGMGLRFGLWFEPEAVNVDSELYGAHPDWAIRDAGREDVYGRSELLLDLTRSEVRDYIVENVGRVLDSADISYVKWDMNRHLAGGDGAFAHKYILGLYEVMERIFTPLPHILLESCSSGGNRFDLGMLCHSPQIWASDNTDPIERLDIQRGLSYLYPLSAAGAHVTAAPHAQTLRTPPLSTRYNVSCFGCLGYELDLTKLTPVEASEVREQIKFYKKHRRTFQYGDFYRSDPLPDDQEGFTCAAKDGSEAVCGHFRRLVHSAPAFDFLPAEGLDSAARYRVETKRQTIRIGAFGRLIAFALPLKVAPDGFIIRSADKLMGLHDCAESYLASGSAVMSGIRLKNLFNGTGYNEQIRLPGDFGSNLYLITRAGKAK